MKLNHNLLLGICVFATSLAAADINVPAGGNLQAALNTAQSGDTVTLAAGATYTGHFQLKPNGGSQWITIQSSGIGSLPAGIRVSPNQSSLLAKIVTPDGAPALAIANGANFYRVRGLEFTPATGVYAQDVIQVGLGNEISTTQLPHDIDFDRVYVHGDASAGSKRGIALNGGSTTVENSYFSGFFSTWQDTQALAGWNGPGPYQILNNYLEAGTETVAFGGAVPTISGLVPSDILIKNNYFFKPLSWKPGSGSYAGIPVWVKNHLELKNGQRITIDNNVLENNWVGADQRGFAFVFSVRTEIGAVPWAVVNDIKVMNNIIRHSAAGIVFTGHDDNPAGSGSSSGYTIQNNVWQDISSSWGGDGRLFQILSGVQNISIDHNTAFQSGYLMVFDGCTSYNVSYTNNIAYTGWGVVGNGTAEGTATLNAYTGGGLFSGNVLIGGVASRYPSNNYFLAGVSQVGFVDFAGGNFSLSSASPYSGAGAGGGSTVNPTSPTPQIPSGWVNLISKNSGKCMDVAFASTAPAAGILQYDCWGGDNQKFLLTPVSGGYKITVKHSGLGLDVGGGPAATYDGPPIIQWPYWGGSNEIFQLNPTSDGYFTINPLSSGKCLDVAGVSKDNGAPLIQWSCWGGDNQKWILSPTQ